MKYSRLAKLRSKVCAIDTPQPYWRGDSSFIDSTCSDKIALTWVEVESPAALGSKIQVPVCPTVLKANFRILIAAFESLSKTNPHPQTWVLIDRDFLTIAPQLEQFWEVKAGLTATVALPNLTPKYSNHFLNWYQPASLIDLARQWFKLKFLILKSS